jgi:hypothetical protein
VLYATPNLVSFPANKDKPGRYLGIVWNVGDMLTYYVESDSTEHNHRKHVVLARSAVVSDNAKNSRATSSRKNQESVTESSHCWDIWEDTNDYDEPTSHFDHNNVTSEPEIEDIFLNSNIDQKESHKLDPYLNIDEDEDEAFQLSSIESHRTRGKSKKPQLLCRWKDDNTSWEDFHNVRIDFPLLVASYFGKQRLGVPYKPSWAKSINQQIETTQRRIRKTDHKPVEIFGVIIPKNVKHAYELDKENGNTLWKDAMQKEIKSLLKMNIFQFHPLNYKLSKE